MFKRIQCWLTCPRLLMSRFSTFVFSFGIQGGSTTGRFSIPILGLGRVNSIWLGVTFMLICPFSSKRGQIWYLDQSSWQQMHPTSYCHCPQLTWTSRGPVSWGWRSPWREAESHEDLGSAEQLFSAAFSHSPQPTQPRSSLNISNINCFRSDF